MPDKPFFDTNILVYSVAIGDPRRPVALNLLLEGGSISVQGLNEFANVTAGKMKIPWPKVVGWLETIQGLCNPVIPVSLDTHRLAVQIARQASYHFYDSLMLAAALEADCNIFYSEDLRDGHVIDALTIRNPFPQKKKRS